MELLNVFLQTLLITFSLATGLVIKAHIYMYPSKDSIDLSILSWALIILSILNLIVLLTFVIMGGLE